MPRHIEQPAPRHSKPASMKISSQAARFGLAADAACDPGTTSALTCGATWRPRTIRAASSRSDSRPLVHDPMNATSIGVPSTRDAGVESHERERFVDRRSPPRISASPMPTDCPGLMPQVTVGSIDAASIVTRSSYGASASDAIDRHHATARSNASPCGANRRPAQERERRLVRVDVADARAAFDRHVADRHALVDRHAVDGAAAVFVGEADAALDAEPPDDRQDHVLRVDAGRQAAVDVDAPHLQRIERQALRREHVAHLRGADAERDRAERAVRRRVAVAARDGHARLREPELRADDVDDALVLARRRRLARRPRAGCRTRGSCARAPSSSPRPSDRGTAAAASRSARCDRRCANVRSGKATRQPCWRSMSNACGDRDFVDEMEADEQLRLPARQRADGVRVPDFLKKRLSHGFVWRLQ